ncbi:hypothetical protein EBZ80_10315 [bacterium]|nr:hypothetical protein [bacterium]
MTIVHEKELVWLQRDALGPLNPAIQAYPRATRIFVFDTCWMNEERPSPNRMRFIEECGAEIQAKLVHGDAVRRLLEECRVTRVTSVVTTGTPCRHARAAISELMKSIPVDVLELPRLISDPGPFDLRSFSRFWSRASGSAFGSG